MTATTTPRQHAPRTTVAAQLPLLPLLPVSAPEAEQPDLADRWAAVKQELDSWRRLAWTDEDGAE